MENPNRKEVLFSEFCPKCEFENVIETENPCDYCLEEGARCESSRPVKFLEKKRKEKE